MSNDNSTKYYDLHTSGAGFLNRCREVKPKAGSGSKFKPFWSVAIGAFRGSEENVEYTNFDCNIAGGKALEIIQQYKDQINDQSSKVICGFTIGDIYGYSFTTKNKETQQDENRCGIKGRLIFIQFIKIDGEMVYKHEKPQTEDDDNTETQPQSNDRTASNEIVTDSSSEHLAQESEACPFNEQLGNTVTLAQDDPDFDKKKDWLKANGYKWDNENKHWLLSAS